MQAAEDTFERIGGFGRYQLFLNINKLFSSKFSTEFLLIALAYLEKVPEEYFCVYQGSTEAISCKPVDFCEDPTV